MLGCLGFIWSGANLETKKWESECVHIVCMYRQREKVVSVRSFVEGEKWEAEF